MQNVTTKKKSAVFIYLFIYLFNISWPVRRLPINMRGQVIANHGKLKGKKKERCCQRGKGDRERKRKGGTLIIHGITSDETVWKAGL